MSPLRKYWVLGYKRFRHANVIVELQAEASLITTQNENEQHRVSKYNFQ